MNKPLGSGAFGHVYPCFYGLGSKVRAAKLINKKQPQNLFQFIPEFEDKKSDIEILVEREFECNSSLKHPNIVKLFAFISNETDYIFIFEYCSEGSLGQFIKQK